MSRTAYAVLGKNEASTNLIDEYVMENLADLDEIAYIRFASIYRQFKDISVLLKELRDVVGKTREDNKENSKENNKENN